MFYDAYFTANLEGRDTRTNTDGRHDGPMRHMSAVSVGSFD